jgi:tetratricopeptide (TPR) repeat protein
MTTETNNSLSQAKLQQALLFQQKGFLPQAKTFYEEAIQLDPTNFEALHNLGLLMFESGNNQKAFELMLLAIESNPQNPDLFNNLGIVLESLQEFNAALASYDASIALKPDSAETHSNRGNALKTLQQWEAAIAGYNQAIALKPDFWQAISNRGLALQKLGQLEAAIASYQQAISINPNVAEIYSNLGNALEELQQFDDALFNHNQAIALKPDHVDAYVNRGNTYMTLHDWNQAKTNYNQAIAIKPDHADAHWNYALLLLLRADFENGWLEYEWRFKKTNFSNQLPITHHRRWKPGSMTPRLLIWAEQGLNSHIFFGSLLSEISKFAGQLLVTIDEQLIPLFARTMPEISFIPNTQTIDDELFDAYLPLGSLGRYLRSSADSFKNTPSAYLAADKTQTENLRQQLHTEGAFFIGIAWQNLHDQTHLPESLNVTDLITALNHPNIKLVSLQPISAEDIANLKAVTGVDLLPCPITHSQDNLDSLAALIEACDLVVSTDNTIAHLAGALHKATWVLLPFTPEWRWQLNRTDSPWYPSLQLYRQNGRNDWQSALNQITADLQSIAPPALS